MKRQILFVLALCAYTVSHAQQPLYVDGEEKKVAELASVINVNSMQRTAISEAYNKKRRKTEALDTTADAKSRAFKKYEIDKACHEELIKQLSDRQISEYCNTAFAPEVTAKTEYRMSLLAELENEYTAAELEKIRGEIYRYLMLEKIVYFRYKYDFAKQKAAISRLKTIQPQSLKASMNIEKQKNYGKFFNGKINWKQ